MSKKIAIVGTGLIGRSWSIVFARAGFEVWLWDPVEGAVLTAIKLIKEGLPSLAEESLLNGFWEIELEMKSQKRQKLICQKI